LAQSGRQDRADRCPLSGGKADIDANAVCANRRYTLLPDTRHRPMITSTPVTLALSGCKVVTMGQLQNINHIVVLMLENRSFDSLLGTLYKNATFEGLSGTEQNPDTKGAPVVV
jgi:phospholipase C